VPPRIDIIAVGKLGADMRPAFEHYRHLLASLVRIEVREVRETPLRGRSPDEVLRDEGRRLAAALPDAGTVVALAIDGRESDSETFSGGLQRWLERGPVAFVIGGSLGLADEVRRAADAELSLSRLTLPHQLARVVLAEQLFRALKIARRETYHH
jgi:23S rRNA (pseudouridine1915-N3)-methyltransferase